MYRVDQVLLNVQQSGSGRPEFNATYPCTYDGATAFSTQLLGGQAAVGHRQICADQGQSNATFDWIRQGKFRIAAEIIGDLARDLDRVVGSVEAGDHPDAVLSLALPLCKCSLTNPNRSHWPHPGNHDTLHFVSR